MLKAGYTSVAEFHYLHGPVGHLPGHNNQVLSLALIEAAKCTGIRLTLLPTLYQHAGFDKAPLLCDQKRFYNSIQDYLVLCEKLNREVCNIPTAKIGVAFHSLRAVASDTFVDVMGYIKQQRKSIPIHIHIAEQTKELEECINHYNQRPLDWLIDNQPVNEDWCLVHATHANSIELRKIISTGATVGLCPITEANLGDGIFPLKQFVELGGKFAIGSDSNIGIDPFEELRWLEYGQRLKLQKRIVAVTKDTRSNGQCLIENALEGGRHALGQSIGQIAPGYQADLLLINPNSPALYGKGKEDLLNSLVFTNSSAAVDSVMVAGKWVVSHLHHFHEEIIEERFKNTMDRIIRQ